MAAAFSAMVGLSSRIKPFDFTLKAYDQLLLGGQVWAGKTTPAINTYLRKADLKGKKVWLFITMADDKVPQNVIDSMSNR